MKAPGIGVPTSVGISGETINGSSSKDMLKLLGHGVEPSRPRS